MMRTRQEIELERDYATLKNPAVLDGTEVPQLLGLVVDILLDIRDQKGAAGPAPSGFGVGNVGAGRTPFEQG